MSDPWDDDWIQKTDQSNEIAVSSETSGSKLSKAERRAKQAEFNRQIWEDAEKAQEENFFLKTKGVVPLKSEFKPAMKLLSRKPNVKSANAATNGMGQLSIDDDEDDDESRKKTITPEERRKQAEREREEKQKAYEERRRELFGTTASSNASSPSRKAGSPRNQSRSTRGGNDSRPSSAASNRVRQLYDPQDSAKPDSMRPAKREPLSNDIQPIREPRNPNGSGRGGAGFAPRGGRGT